MIVSMWNGTLGWNWLNKSESVMTVNIKVNPIQIGPFQGSQELRVGKGGTKKLMLVLEKWNLERGCKYVWKTVKLSTSSIKFYLRQ